MVTCPICIADYNPANKAEQARHLECIGKGGWTIPDIAAACAELMQERDNLFMALHGTLETEDEHAES